MSIASCCRASRSSAASSYRRRGFFLGFLCPVWHDWSKICYKFGYNIGICEGMGVMNKNEAAGILAKRCTIASWLTFHHKQIRRTAVRTLHLTQ